MSGGTFFERFELLQFPFDAQDLQISIMALHHLKTQDELSMAGRRRSVGEERVLQTRPSGLASGGSGGLTGPWWTVDASSDRRAQCFGTPGRYGPPGAPHLIKNENVKYKPVVPFDTFVLQDEYVLVNGVFALEKLSDARTSATRMRYPLLVLSLKIVRRAQVYIQNVVLPTFLFVVLGFMSFAFKPDDLSDRLSLVTSLLLTAVTYQQFVSEQLPKTIDTELHRYVQTAIFVLFVVGIEAVALNKLNEWVSSASSDAAVEERAQLIAYNEDGAAFVVLCVWIAKHFRYLGYLLNVVGPEDGYSGDVPKTQLQTEVEAEIELLKAVLENYTNNDEQQENNVARYRQSLRIYERWVKDMSEFQQKSDEKQAATLAGQHPRAVVVVVMPSRPGKSCIARISAPLLTPTDSTTASRARQRRRGAESVNDDRGASSCLPLLPSWWVLSLASSYRGSGKNERRCVMVVVVASYPLFFSGARAVVNKTDMGHFCVAAHADVWKRTRTSMYALRFVVQFE